MFYSNGVPDGRIGPIKCRLVSRAYLTRTVVWGTFLETRFIKFNSLGILFKTIMIMICCLFGATAVGGMGPGRGASPSY